MKVQSKLFLWMAVFFFAMSGVYAFATMTSDRHIEPIGLTVFIPAWPTHEQNRHEHRSQDGGESAEEADEGGGEEEEEVFAAAGALDPGAAEAAGPAGEGAQTPAGVSSVMER